MGRGIDAIGTTVSDGAAVRTYLPCQGRSSPPSAAALGSEPGEGVRAWSSLIVTSRFRCKRRRWRVEAAWRRPLQKKNRSSGHELLDHLISAQQNRRGYGKTERRRGPAVHDHLKFCRKLHREIARLLAAQDAIDIGGGATKEGLRC